MKKNKNDFLTLSDVQWCYTRDNKYNWIADGQLCEPFIVNESKTRIKLLNNGVVFDLSNADNEKEFDSKVIDLISRFYGVDQAKYSIDNSFVLMKNKVGMNRIKTNATRKVRARLLLNESLLEPINENSIVEHFVDKKKLSIDEIIEISKVCQSELLNNYVSYMKYFEDYRKSPQYAANYL